MTIYNLWQNSSALQEKNSFHWNIKLRIDLLSLLSLSGNVLPVILLTQWKYLFIFFQMPNRNYDRRNFKNKPLNGLLIVFRENFSIKFFFCFSFGFSSQNGYERNFENIQSQILHYKLSSLFSYKFTHTHTPFTLIMKNIPD